MLVMLVFIVCVAPDAVMSVFFHVEQHDEAYVLRSVREVNREQTEFDCVIVLYSALTRSCHVEQASAVMFFHEEQHDEAYVLRSV
jgi:hypothetical protein